MDARIDLERARRDAKALLRAARAGEVVLRPDRAPVLADAQREVAVGLGYASWPALVAGVRGAGLLAAAREGRADDVYRALMDGAPANARDETGRTALHLAAAGGFVDVVDVLVGWAAVDRSAVDSSGRTAWSEDPVVLRILAPRPAPESDSALGSLACEADAALFSLLAGSPLAARRAVGDGFAFRTGLFDNTRNGVVCSRVEDVSDAIAWIGGAPAQWLVGEDSELGPALERAGCRPERGTVFIARTDADATREDAAPGGDAARGGDATFGGDAPARSDATPGGDIPARSDATPAGDVPARSEAPGGDAPAREDAAPGGDAPAREHAAPGDVAAPRDGIVPIADASLLRAAMEAVGALEYDEREVALLASLAFGGPLRHYAAMRDGAPVGIASAFAWRGTVTLTQLAVAPAWRRRGVGRALVRFSGATLLAPTPATVPFYESLGFRLLRYPPDRAFYLPV